MLAASAARKKQGHVSTAKLRKTFEAIKGLAKTGSRGGVYCS